METTSGSALKRRERHWSTRRTGKRGGRLSLGAREQRRLLQLAVSVVLFVAVFIGKGVFPEKIVQLREELTGIVGSDTDFRAAFANLGRSISSGEPIAETMGDLFVEVFGGSTLLVQPPIETLLPSYVAERTFLSQPATAHSILQRRFILPKTDPVPEPPAESLPPQPTPATEPIQVEEPAVVHMDYSGPAMPANSTMDKHTLGLATTVSPVSDWWASSGFGWREHPVEGGEKFHHGLDMAVNEGTQVKAFAEGTVEFIGDSPDIYGLYLQIKHDNGVTTFYAHNSELLVQRGQRVMVGDVIAQSGDTGNVTGPHLHFEIKKDGILLNPLYYLDKG